MTINFCLKKSKENANGEVPVYLRLTQHRRSKLRSTGLYIKESDWNPTKQRLRKSNSRSSQYNAHLSDIEVELFNIRQQLTHKYDRQPRMDEVLDVFEDKIVVDKNLSQFMRDFIEKNDDKYHFQKRLNHVYNKLHKYAGKKNIEFSEVSPEFLEDWSSHMMEKEGLRDTTVARYHCAVRRTIQAAIRANYLKREQDPFLFFHFTKSEGSTKVRLRREELIKMKEVDLPEDTLIWHTRNVFFFMFYCAGVQIGDTCKLTWRNIQDGSLVYVMSKTKHKKGYERNITLVPQALEILKLYKNESTKPYDYIFPLLKNETNYSRRELEKSISRITAKLNVRLKKIAKAAGVQRNISTHVARHSYADIRRKNGDGLYEINKALGHTKFETTQRYLADFDKQYVDEKHFSALEGI